MIAAQELLLRWSLLALSTVWRVYFGTFWFSFDLKS